jgi:hypothetical protein
MHQHHPEFTHSSYMRLRSLEDAFQMTNYLDKASKVETSPKISLTQKLANTFAKKAPAIECITAHDRSYGILKIFDLHSKKEYKRETLFIAAGIFDRYIQMMGA